MWEIPHKFRCPVIGICFELDQLRGLMAKAKHFPRERTDFVLQTSAVGACESVGRQSECSAQHPARNIARLQRSSSTGASANDAEAPANLSGKCILCVGRRLGAVDAYRREVEQRGGKQCLFIKSSGVSSFGRIVSAACVPVEATSTTGTSC